MDRIALMSQALERTPRASRKVALLKLASVWRRAVGSPLHAVASPRECRGACLVVEVLDPIWKRELERHEVEILSRLRSLLPEPRIEEILFRVVPGASVPRNEAGRTARSRSSGGPGERIRAVAGLPLETISQEDLRERLRGVAGRYLGRRR